jgi:hypothetical protein
LGILYFEGNGVELDQNIALELFIKGANLDDGECAFNAGLILGGVDENSKLKTDYSRAADYLRLAAKFGCESPDVLQVLALVESKLRLEQLHNQLHTLTTDNQNHQQQAILNTLRPRAFGGKGSEGVEKQVPSSSSNPTASNKKDVSVKALWITALISAGVVGAIIVSMLVYNNREAINWGVVKNLALIIGVILLIIAPFAGILYLAGRDSGASNPVREKPCPTCGKIGSTYVESWDSKREKKADDMTAGCLIVLGLFLSPVIIGIPLLLFGLYLSFRSPRKMVKCSKCSTKFEIKI